MHNGIDLVEIKRIEQVFDKIKDKVYTKEELEYIKEHNNSMEVKAGIFAAKEATLKSLGMGLEANLKEIQVAHHNTCPYLVFKGKLKKEIEAKHLSFCVSISHEKDYAIASVINYQGTNS